MLRVRRNALSDEPRCAAAETERRNSERARGRAPVKDTDVTQLQEWLQHIGLPKIGRDQVFQAVDLRAVERSYHPVRDYLDGLVWDRATRASNFFPTYFGAEKPPMSRPSARCSFAQWSPGSTSLEANPITWWFWRARRAYLNRQPAKCWAGNGIPTICRTSLSEKDAFQHLRGKWLIEIAEMSAISKAEDAALKAFLTRMTEIYRPIYGRCEVHQPRQCNFVGSTSKEAYLARDRRPPLLACRGRCDRPRRTHAGSRPTFCGSHRALPQGRSMVAGRRL